MTNAHIVGNIGERIAEYYLCCNGYRIMERNVRCKRDEIDLIAWDKGGQMLVFIEVKSRKSGDARYPTRLAVNIRKRTCLRRAMAHWCNRHHYDGAARLDIVCVEGKEIAEHVKNVGSELFVD